MPLSPQNQSRYEIVTVPCLSDNYAFLIHDAETGDTALVDAPEAGPVQKALTDRGWTLSEIVLTHHHDDHIQAVPLLRPGATVIGAAADAHRLPNLDRAVVPGQKITLCGLESYVIDVSGHTVGHIAVHLPGLGAAFTGDSLMAMGCGRLSEGTAAQMWQSLQRLRDLPDETIICSGHEYTTANMAFALSLEPDHRHLLARSAAIDAARAAGRPTVPSTLAEEKATNPFLRADDPGLQRAIGMADADPAQVFAQVRGRKDRF